MIEFSPIKSSECVSPPPKYLARETRAFFLNFQKDLGEAKEIFSCSEIKETASEATSNSG
jgi:hypothetical protein